RFLAVDRSPTVSSQAAAIASAAPPEDRDNTYVEFYDSNPKKSRKMKKSPDLVVLDASPSPKAKKLKKASSMAAKVCYSQTTPKSKIVMKSPAVADSSSSTMVWNEANSPDVMILPPPPKPPHIFFVEDVPQTPWTRHIGSNGVQYFFNPSSGKLQYMPPPGWSTPTTLPSSPPPPKETPTNATAKQSPIISTSTGFAPKARKSMQPDIEVITLSDDSQENAPPKKKLRVVDSLLQFAEKHNIPYEKLEGLLIDRSMDDKAAHNRSTLNEVELRYDREYQYKMTIAREARREKTLLLKEAEGHKRTAEGDAKVVQYLHEQMAGKTE
ncbi:hypothetical protein PENTCL1PPCAC_24871, partial [Pristionchus entomophagus]